MHARSSNYETVGGDFLFSYCQPRRCQQNNLNNENRIVVGTQSEENIEKQNIGTTAPRAVCYGGVFRDLDPTSTPNMEQFHSVRKMSSGSTRPAERLASPLPFSKDSNSSSSRKLRGTERKLRSKPRLRQCKQSGGGNTRRNQKEENQGMSSALMASSRNRLN